jgi:hypothetical protein
MKPSPSSIRQPVLIVEAEEFTEKVDKFLTPTDERGLSLLLAEDPVRGIPVPGFPGLLYLLYAGCTIFYSVAPNLLTVYLLDIEKAGGSSPPPAKADVTLLRKMLTLLGKGAVIAVVKRGLKGLWEYLKDDFPFTL